MPNKMIARRLDITESTVKVNACSGRQLAR
ncbi:hypothetical protein [Enterobacter hormaechei]